jgi:hypothetical protein
MTCHNVAQLVTDADEVPSSDRQETLSQEGAVVWIESQKLDSSDALALARSALVPSASHRQSHAASSIMGPNAYLGK